MNAWGGQRSGAGRKTKAEKHATAIEQAEAQVCDHLPQLVDHMLQLAYGIKREKKTPQGKLVVYSVPPNYKALAYLIDRVMGKPTERQEISGPDGGAMSIEFEERMMRAIDKAYPVPPKDPTEEAARALTLVNGLPDEGMN